VVSTVAAQSAAAQPTRWGRAAVGKHQKGRTPQHVWGLALL